MATHRTAVDPNPDLPSVGDAASAMFRLSRPFEKNEGAGSSANSANVQLIGKENVCGADPPATSSWALGKSAATPRKNLVSTKKKMKPFRTPIQISSAEGNGHHLTPSRLVVNPFAGVCSDTSFASALQADEDYVDMTKTPSKDPSNDTHTSSAHHLCHLGHPGGLIRLPPFRIHKPHPKPARHRALISCRVGSDGTSHPPSNELLRSTACSRAQKAVPEQDKSARQCATSQGKTGLSSENGHLQQRKPAENMGHCAPQIVPRGQNVSFDQSFDVEDELADDVSTLSINVDNHDESSDSSIIRSVSTNFRPEGCTREFIGNPVAITLLNNGKEDLRHLVERDRVSRPSAPEDNRGEHSEASLPSWYKRVSPIFPGSVAQGSNARAASAANNVGTVYRASPIQTVCEVSGNLSDVKNEKEVASLLRPTAVLARPSRVHPIE